MAVMGRLNSISTLNKSAQTAPDLASINMRPHWQRSSSASYVHYSLTRTLLLYCFIAVWFIATAESSTKAHTPGEISTAATILEESSTATSQSETTLHTSTPELPISDKRKKCRQDYGVLLIKKSKDSPSPKNQSDFVPYVNPNALITLTNNLAHLSEDVICTIKKKNIQDVAYLIIDTSVQSIQISACTPLYKQSVTIYDTASKWFVTCYGKVAAKSLYSVNSYIKDPYIITIYFKNGNLICTFMKAGTNLYLVYEKEQITLKTMPLEEVDTCSDTSIFYFKISDDGSMNYSFSPVTAPQLFISTSRRDCFPVTVKNDSDQTYINDFGFAADSNNFMFNFGSNGLAVIFL
ncbi:uncharacterized protein LOC128663450 [Bombina bombina]|uniref:uncharacterized protein LOC128663450 n=1 Tax=Bombina bombina TaxID=8345 RepID=UPI00235A65A0|nr:uncharacterized protein LOC128663450 [Bombina bombina]XP_053573755.1 uncharacterized protein LOC128663450 [Bombina bombina]